MSRVGHPASARGASEAIESTCLRCMAQKTRTNSARWKATMMDERTYRLLVDDTLHHIDAAFDDVDPDLAESSISQGALTIAFPNGLRAIVSPQPPVRQMWLAFRDRGYHFNWDPERERWIDDKGLGLELYRLVSDLTRETAGVELELG